MKTHSSCITHPEAQSKRAEEQDFKHGGSGSSALTFKHRHLPVHLSGLQHCEMGALSVPSIQHRWWLSTYAIYSDRSGSWPRDKWAPLPCQGCVSIICIKTPYVPVAALSKQSYEITQTFSTPQDLYLKGGGRRGERKNIIDPFFTPSKPTFFH